MSKATDKRPQFFLIEDAVIDNFDLDPYSGWLYVVIVKHADRKTGEAFPGITRLTKLAHMSRAQVIRSIKKLEDCGLLRVERDTLPDKGEKRQREVNHYYVLTATGSVYQRREVVSDSDYPSTEQTLGVVSPVDCNKNQSEQESINEVEQPRKSKRSVATKATTPAEMELIEAWCTAMGYDGAKAGATYDTNYNRAAARKMLKWDAPATPEEVRKVVILNRRGRQDYSMDFVRQDIPVMRAQENLGAVKPAFVSEWDRVRNRDTQGGQK